MSASPSSAENMSLFFFMLADFFAGARSNAGSGATPSACAGARRGRSPGAETTAGAEDEAAIFLA